MIEAEFRETSLQCLDDFSSYLPKANVLHLRMILFGAQVFWLHSVVRSPSQKKGFFVSVRTDLFA